MLTNYLKIAWRNLMKNKIFSFINIFGLTVGLTCCMLISLYLKYETSYDTHHKDVSRLYQLGTIFIKSGQKEDKSANTPAPMAEGLKNEFPEIEQSTRILGLFGEDKTLFQRDMGKGEKKSFYESKGYVTEPTFFKLFNYDFIEGNATTALHEPNSIVISQEIAQKLFDKESALNQRIHISSNTNGDRDYLISGVFKPSVTPSHLPARFFMSIKGGDMEGYIKNHGNDFASNNMFYTYLKLRPDADAKKLEAKFPSFMKKYAAEDLKKMGFDKKQFLIPVKDIHLSSDVPRNATPPASRTYLYILASIAVFTLLIACINFMNLATARSSKRSTEVGVRKVLGAKKNILIWQFIGESLLMSVLAFMLAIVLTAVLLPLFNKASGRELNISQLTNGWLVAGFFALAILTGLLAGSYPAFYLSSFKPASVLKGKFQNSLAAVSLRKGLVVFQFIISVVLITAAVIISRQMQYLRKADLGFAKEQQVIIPLRSGNAKNMYQAFSTQVRNDPQVASVGASLYYPGIFNPADNGFYKAGQTMNDAKRTRMNWVDVDFLKTLGVQVLAGRLFSEKFPSDTSFRVVLNEKAVKDIGLGTAQKAVGQKVFFDWQGKNYGFEIIGVVKDFHFEDLHLPITPYAFQLNTGNGYNYLMVHAKQGNVQPLLDRMKILWHKYNSDEPFEYSFLDEDFQRNYVAEDRLASIVNYFTLIAIVISCLGLFGLATFSAEQRIKEIGVRKVLGASVSSIVTLLSKDFLKLVIVAVVIACPLAWWAMNKWLEDFAYRTNISWTVFAITALIAVVIALLTISFQAIKAATANPVKSLRTE
ncbi:MAG: FtsX-like permease family protein [Chitinophagaceae bacterium]|nr:FtsX-like permease family protein [Chitinophagaceae bacterium]